MLFIMQACLNCNEEFFQGDICPTCGSKKILFERAENEMYMKTKQKKMWKCPKCGFTTESEEKITSCQNCNWNVNVVKQLDKGFY